MVRSHDTSVYRYQHSVNGHYIYDVNIVSDDRDLSVWLCRVDLDISIRMDSVLKASYTYPQFIDLVQSRLADYVFQYESKLPVELMMCDDGSIEERTDPHFYEYMCKEIEYEHRDLMG